MVADFKFSLHPKRFLSVKIIFLINIVQRWGRKSLHSRFWSTCCTSLHWREWASASQSKDKTIELACQACLASLLATLFIPFWSCFSYPPCYLYFLLPAKCHNVWILIQNTDNIDFILILVEYLQNNKE